MPIAECAEHVERRRVAENADRRRPCRVRGVSARLELRDTSMLSDSELDIDEPQAQATLLQRVIASSPRKSTGTITSSPRWQRTIFLWNSAAMPTRFAAEPELTISACRDAELARRSPPRTGGRSVRSVSLTAVDDAVKRRDLLFVPRTAVARS